ncbi:hypothetical protein IEQ34_008394 [Dendrobium chrysotoxum]|uniref:Uncharacterized protein n=1 Tax=Dendrobium chrysotoxum TaxID=161865 RepID=A0AAV7GZA0_DENCH|nr:hypothetical protein IEQ34_008394 [Dendrobium chrysotoxum]
MMRKLMEMQSKTPLAVPIANPNQDLTKIPLIKSKGKEIGRKEFDEESFFHQEPPPRAMIKGRSGFSERGQQGGYFVVEVDYYRRHFR